MRVNLLWDFAIFDSRNKETTLFLNRKEIVVSFLVLENPSWKSGVNPHSLELGIVSVRKPENVVTLATFQDFL